MKINLVYIALSISILAIGCQKEVRTDLIIPVPNGDFEAWDARPVPDKWTTNSCPECLPAFETYIVRKSADAQTGTSAAGFIYNNVYPSYAFNKFEIDHHPDVLTGHIKSYITAGDTAAIHIDIYSGNNITDSGHYTETFSHTSYVKIEIPITQASAQADSAFIKITGGKKEGTEIIVDNLVLIRKE